MPRIIFLSYNHLNFHNHSGSLSLFHNQTSSFSHALQIYCLGLLGQNPILFWIQAKTGPYNWRRLWGEPDLF